MREQRSRDVRISDELLSSTAAQMAEKLGIPDFGASKGWRDGWKKRKGVRLRNISGEAKSADVEAADAWKTTILPGLLEEFGPDLTFGPDIT